MEMRCVVNAQIVSEESVTCIAVNEDRHQNIMSSVALKRGVEEPWTTEDHLGKRHSASNHCVQKPCGRNVQSRSYNRRCSDIRQAIERAHREHCDAATWNHQNRQMPHGKQHARRTWKRPSVRKVETQALFERLHGRKPSNTSD